MSTPRADQTRLSAIVFTDIVGYSALVHRDAALGKRLLDRQRAVVREQLGVYGGREVETAGDSFLLLFDSTMTALACVAAIQRTLAEDRTQAAPVVELRASVHLGDIEIRSDGVYGDGVNVAARILPYAPAGGVAISDIVQRQLRNRLALPAVSIGSPALKNIEQPVEIFTLEPAALSAVPAQPPESATPEAVHPALYATQSRKSREQRPEERGATLIWRFAGASFDERALELSVGNQQVELERKPLEVLRHLLWHAGEVVTRDELLDAVWPGRVLSESVITKCISRLREVLGDTDQALIKTVHGYGYRLIAEVRVEHPKSTLAASRFAFQAGDAPPLRPSWKLIERLGVGGHGEAWLAEHEKTRDRRVYKFAFDEDALVALKREITLYRLLRDTLGEREDFVRILDWNLAEAPCFTEAEYVPGGNLLSWADARGGLGQVPLALRLELAAQIADTLAAAHSVGVLHKDLKPANVLIAGSEPPRIKLMDFGSGGVINPQQLDQLGITRLGFTQAVDGQTTTTSGTALYLAPEVIAGHPVTVQSDVYALGIVLYQLVVGDLRRPLAPGWELDIDDELLREDIAAAAHGHPQHRLADAGQLAQRLRQLDVRRAQREAERARAAAQAQALAEAERTRHENDKLRARRTGLLLAVAVLILGLGVSTRLYLDARTARIDAERKQVQAEALGDFLQWDFFSAANPDENDARMVVGVKALLDAAVPKIDERLGDQPLAAAKVRAGFAETYSRLGFLSDTRRLDDANVELGRQALDRGHPDALEIGLIASVGTHPNARHFEYQLALDALAQARWAPEDPRLLALRGNTAIWYLVAGEPRKALEIFQAVERGHAARRDGDYSSQATLMALGVSYTLGVLGELRESEARSRRELARAQARSAPYSTELLYARSQLVQVLAETGRLAEAEAMLDEARADALATRNARSVGGKELHDLLIRLRFFQGRLDEARRLTDEAFAQWDFDDPSHGPFRLRNLEHLVLQERYAEALPLLRRHIDIETPNYPDSFPTLTNARLLLAECLAAQGQAADAQAELDRIPTAGIAKLEDVPTSRLLWLRARALVARSGGDHDTATALLSEALALARDLYTEQGPWARLVADELASFEAGSLSF